MYIIITLLQSCQQTNDESEAYGIGSIETEAIYKNTDGSYIITYINGQEDRWEIKLWTSWVLKCY